MSSSPGNRFYFSLCLIVLYQGEPGPKGDKGDRGMSGEPVSTDKCFLQLALNFSRERT